MAKINLKQLSLKKKIIFGIVFLFVTFVVFSLVYKNTRPSKYEVSPAVFASITEVVSETGNVTTTGAVPMYSTTKGIVETVFISNGDQVLDGDTLFSVNSTATKQEKAAALSTYLAAKDAWETAKATQLSLQASMFTQWDQFKQLAESDTYEDSDGNAKYNERNLPEFHVSQKEWLASEASYKNQQIAVDQAAANMSAAYQAYQATQDSEVSAVISGEIRNLSVTGGDMVNVYNTLTASSISPALIIFNPDVETIVKIDVDETEAIKVKKDQDAQIKFDAIPNKVFSGKVSRVDSLAVPTTGVVKYSIYVVLDEKLENIKGGMTADVDVVVNIKDSVLSVPTSAVKPFEGGRAVRIVGKDDEIVYLPVQTGIRGDGKIEIISGIDEGTEVITALKNEQVERKSTLF